MSSQPPPTSVREQAGPLPVAVFHPGTQHSWQTALALQHLDRLAWYATSIYYQPERWPYKLAKILPEAFSTKLEAEFRRFSQTELDPRRVRTVGLVEWIERVAARAGLRRLAERIDVIGNRRFASLLKKEIRGREDFALWGYNSSSRDAFEHGRERGRVCILDRTNGDFRAYNRAMDEIADRYGEWFLTVERRVPQSVIDNDDREYELADTILVGSRFAERTVRENARDSSVGRKLRVLNYCFDNSLFGGLPAPRVGAHDRPVRFLFLGQLNPRKGVHHVLEAIDRISPTGAELTLVGDLRVPKRAFARYADRVNYIRTVARADVPEIMAAHDVLLFPTYFEGAGIVLYEALAAGMALIQSDRAALAVTPDTGIMLEAPDTDMLYDAMMTTIEDRHRLDGWRASAPSEAQKYTFARYGENIRNLLAELGL